MSVPIGHLMNKKTVFKYRTQVKKVWLCKLTAVFDPVHLSDSFGESDQSHVVAVVHIFKQLA